MSYDTGCPLCSAILPSNELPDHLTQHQKDITEKQRLDRVIRQEADRRKLDERHVEEQKKTRGE